MIYVFKTSVRTKAQAKMLGPYLNKTVPGDQWNFDLQDCDRILRIDSEEDVVPRILNLLRMHEFYCEELQ